MRPSTADLLAAADFVDKLSHSKYLLEKFLSHRTTEMTLDSKLVFRLCSTVIEPEEARNKMILSSKREKHKRSSLWTIRWTPGQKYLAYVLTKEPYGCIGLTR